MAPSRNACPPRARPHAASLETVSLSPSPRVADYREAMALANREAEGRLGEHMLLSWYDRDRDFESPAHGSECHAEAAVPGYVDYAVHHGATLEVDVENGRFAFFYRPVEIES